jgi:hypothetical protein
VIWEVVRDGGKEEGGTTRKEIGEEVGDVKTKADGIRTEKKNSGRENECWHSESF